MATFPPQPMEFSSSADIDKIVAAKAPSFNKIQQTSTSEPQTIQQQLLRINKNP